MTGTAALSGRTLARTTLALAALAAVLMGDTCNDPPLGPVAGAPEYQHLLLHPVFGADVNVAGGNLYLRRVDLAIDIRLGTYELARSYNSANWSWRFEFEMTYDGTTFVDPTGAQYPVSALAGGAAIPGTHWVKVDAHALRTKGGLVHVFAGDGRLVQIYRRDLAFPRLNFVGATIAGKVRTIEIEQCETAADCTTFFDITYNANGRVSNVTDRADREASYVWDAAGNLLTAKNGRDTANGHLGTRYEYLAPTQRMSSQTSSAGERIEYVYESGRVAQARAVGVENPTTRFTYRGKGSDAFYDTDVFSPSNARTTYSFDAQRRATLRRNAQTGDAVSWQWTGNRPSQQTFPGGVVTRWTYTNDDIATATLPSGNVVTYTYQANAVNVGKPLETALARIEDTLGLVEQRAYDAAGRVISTTNGAGEATTFTYTALGHVSKSTSPLGMATNYNDYGKHGHPRQSVRGDLTLEYVYDAVGNLLEGPGGTGETAPGLGGIVSRKFDEMRDVSEVTLADLDENGQATITRKLQFERRADGKRSALRRPYGGDWEYVYDAIGRLKELRERVGGAWRITSHSYDGYGRKSAVQRPNGMRTEWTYDASDRLVSTRLIEDGVVQATETVSYQHNRLVGRSDTSHPGGETISYDTAGRISRVDHPRGERKDTGYDLRSRPTTEVYYNASDVVITSLIRTYDLADRPRLVFENLELVLDHEYADGMLSKTTYGNGLERSYEFEPTLGVLEKATTVNPAGQHVEDTNVDWSVPLFQVDASTQTRGGLPVTRTETYYMGPFFGAQVPGLRVVGWSRDGGSTSRDFAYDELNNLRTVNDGGRTFHYNPERNRLNSITGGGAHSYSYDEAGYVTARDGVAVDWDAGGRIKSIGSTASFTWDVPGRPMLRNLDGTLFVYLFGGEMKANLFLAPYALDLGDVEVRLQTGSRLYRHMDFRGNVKFVTDDAGNVLTHYRYDPYGLDATAGSTDLEGEFAQGVAAADLVVLGARAYDPDAARFLSPDPVPQLVNQYAYTMANPVLFWDPSGTTFLANLGFTGSALGGGAAAVAATGATGLSAQAVFAAGAAYGLAVANFAYQIANPGERGLTAQDLLNAISPWVEATGDKGGAGSASGPSSGVGSAGEGGGGGDGGGGGGGDGGGGDGSSGGGGGGGSGGGGGGSANGGGPGGHFSDSSIGGTFSSLSAAFGYGAYCSPLQQTDVFDRTGRALGFLLPLGLLLGWRARVHARRGSRHGDVS